MRFLKEGENTGRKENKQKILGRRGGVVVGGGGGGGIKKKAKLTPGINPDHLVGTGASTIWKFFWWLFLYGQF